MKSLFESPYRSMIISGLMVYVVTAIFSTGYYNHDEHFQILEFSNYKLGNSPGSDLPWEFEKQIRPALQPALGCLIIRALNTLSIHNPFTYTLILRIITALLSWLVISKTCMILIKEFASEKGKKIFIYMIFFTWFVPLISVRFSSENYSAITFIGALYLIIQANSDQPYYKKQRLAFAGLLLGFSFFFRFQIAFAIAGLGLWLLLIKKIRWADIFILLISALCAITLCIYLDYWLYGRFVLTPVNYFHVNIIEKIAASFGIQPWWYYFVQFTLKAVPPISILLLLFFFAGLYKNLTNVFAWCIIPFLIGHFAVGHKELRFLFPIAFIFIYLAAKGIDYFISIFRISKTIQFIYVLCVIINIPLLSMMMIKSAKPVVNGYRFLYNASLKKEIVLLCKENNFYDTGGMPANFYKSSKVNCIILKDDPEISDYLKENKPGSIYIVENGTSKDNKYTGYDNKIVCHSYPEWIKYFNVNNWISRAGVWEIIELTKIADRLPTNGNKP